jgi:hypothetical protein
MYAQASKFSPMSADGVPPLQRRRWFAILLYDPVGNLSLFDVIMGAFEEGINIDAGLEHSPRCLQPTGGFVGGGCGGDEVRANASTNDRPGMLRVPWSK